MLYLLQWVHLGPCVVDITLHRNCLRISGRELFSKACNIPLSGRFYGRTYRGEPAMLLLLLSLNHFIWILFEETFANRPFPFCENLVLCCHSFPVLDHCDLLRDIKCLFAELIAVWKDVPRNYHLWVTQDSWKLLLTILAYLIDVYPTRRVCSRAWFEVSL